MAGSFQSSTHHSRRPQPAVLSEPREVPEKDPAHPRAPELWSHVEVLQVDAGPAEEGREAVEEEREASGVVPDVTQQDLRRRTLAEERVAQYLLGCDDLVGETLVLGELPYEGEDQGHVPLGGGTDLEFGHLDAAAALNPRTDESLGNLHGVGRRAFEQVIRHAPVAYGMLLNAYPSDVGAGLAGDLERRREVV